jgi:hypothetical protein
MTIAELQAQRAALVAALAEGALRVVFHSGGTRREIEYRSVMELERAISAIDREIAANSGTRINTFLPHFSKGF